MYSACIFCHSSLGRNEALETFQVGRRLAYDQHQGRLWVVCPRCERWNLTPLESRWEAIEEAERSYRGTRLRTSTQNIGMARLKEGLELVRIGAPPRLELAGWRYGDQFGRRRRKFIGYSALGVLATAAPLLGHLGLAAAIVGVAGGSAYHFLDFRKLRRDMHTPTVFLARDDGTVMPLTDRDTWTAELVPGPTPPEWHLRVGYQPRVSGGPARDLKKAAPEAFRGQAARRALAALLPHTNPSGGTARAVRDAVGVIESHSTSDELIQAAARSKGVTDTTAPASPLTRLPSRVSLALEMVVHEDDERRAMDGQWIELELRWREAEVIAGIADGLLIPEEVNARLEALRKAAK